MTDLFAPLNPGQTLLLQTMAVAYLRSGQWPVWHNVVNVLDGHDLDAYEVIKSLPRTGSENSLAGPSYGATWPVHQYHIPSNSRFGLTVAAAVHVPDLVSAMAHPFINVLRVMTQMQINAPVSPDEVKEVTVSPDVLKSALPSLSDEFMARVSLILDNEPPTLSGGSWTGENGDWTRKVERGIRKYRDVQDLRGYIERVTELIPTPAPSVQVPDSPMASWDGYLIDGDSPLVVEAPVLKREYVDEALINELVRQPPIAS